MTKDKEPEVTRKIRAFLPVRSDWLASRSEVALLPDLPIVDPHHHLWKMPESFYQLGDLLKDMSSGHNVRATIAVECGAMYHSDGPVELRPVGETKFISEVAEAFDRDGSDTRRPCCGIVARADLRLGAKVDEVLAAHLVAGGGRLRGIRHVVAMHRDPSVSVSLTSPPEGLLVHGDFRKGFARLSAHGLSFDAWLYHPQLMELADLARTFPDTTIIVDHIGGAISVGPYADRREEAFQEWKAGLATVAKCPNVYLKIGGFGIPLLGGRFNEEALAPSSAELANAWRRHIETCIELFGPDRCMFESNFPVDKGMFNYVCLWNAFKIIADQYSESEKSALFSGTAAKAYRIPLS